jgi:hypothetical protein
LPPGGEADITASEIDAGLLALIAAFALCIGEKFMGANPTSGWHLGILSKKDAPNPQAAFNAGFRVVSSINPEGSVAKIGSRKKGIGQ